MTVTDVHQWLLTSEPGARIAYHGGNLAVDRKRWPALNALAKGILAAQESGFVELTQLRVSDHYYVYLATRTEEIVG